MLYRALLFFVVTCSSAGLQAQFTITGSTVQSSCEEWTLTPDTPNQTGSFYHTTPISLSSPFSLSFNVNFGCDDLGGNGLVFVLKTGPWSVGTGGAGMGYTGMTGNNMGVEFDTRDDDFSLANWDIGADHIGLFKNGSSNHVTTNLNNLSGVATNIKPGYTNIEDCNDHLVEVIWEIVGTDQKITIKVDGVQSLSVQDNFILEVFASNPNVLWGWTSATSTVDNEHIVGMALTPEFSYTPTTCQGQLVNFTDLSTSYNPITDWLWDFDGLGTSTLQNPSFTFITGGYHNVSLTVTNSSNCSETIMIPVGVGFEVDPIADHAFICPGVPDTLHAQAHPYVGYTCCYDLVLKDSWGDGWGNSPGNSVTVYADGVAVGTYSAYNAGGGIAGGTADTFNLCFDTGTLVEIVSTGTTNPGECSYLVIDDGGVIMVPASLLAWSETTKSFTVNCGTPPPAYTYLWDNAPLLNSTTSANPIATLTGPIWFHVAVTDPGTGCTLTDSVLVTTYPDVTATISGNPTICQGSAANLQITFTGTPPFNVTIAGPGGPYTQTGIMALTYNFNATLDGNYTITAVTGSGCNGTFSGTGILDVIVPNSVSIGASASYCDGDVISPLTVLTSAGGTVTWYNNPGLTGPLGTGLSYTPVQGVGTVTYYATETESVLGCVGPADNVVITVNPIPPAPTWLGTTTYCEGDLPTAITANPTLGGTITWYDNVPPATVLSTLNSYNPGLVVGTLCYYITETANACEGPETQICVTVKPTPTAPAVSGDLLYCEGETPTALTATPTIGGTITWTNSFGTPLASGTTYTPGLTVGSTDFHIYETLDGCGGAETIATVVVQATPEVDVPGQLSICYGDSVLVTAVNNGYSITWDDSQVGETVWLGPDTTTDYVVTATNPLCGFASDNITIIVHVLPEIEAGNDTLIGIGGEVTLWAESPGDVTYTWIPAVDECLEDDCSEVYDVPDQATLYVVIATDQIGCENSDSVLVDINGYMEVFVPNIFSPNGDEWNDLLEVKGPRLFNYYIQIYDRWGKVVFESTEQKEYWDGKLDGQELAPQTFVYMLSGESVLGDKISKEGNVTLIK